MPTWGAHTPSGFACCLISFRSCGAFLAVLPRIYPSGAPLCILPGRDAAGTAVGSLAASLRDFLQGLLVHGWPPTIYVRRAGQRLTGSLRQMNTRHQRQEGAEPGTPSDATVIGEEVSAQKGELCLVVRAGEQLYALPVKHVEETMRPLPLSGVAGAPPFVRGVAVIRGIPVPVVDSAAVLANGDQPLSSETRFVALRIAARRVALSVREVIGVRQIDRKQLADLPPLLAHAREHVVTAIGTLDRELLMVLRSGKLVPEDAWAAIDDGENR